MTIATWLLLGLLSVTVATYAISVYNNIARYLNSKCTSTYYMTTDWDITAVLPSVLTGILAGPITAVFAIAALMDVYEISKELK